ncbi:MAG: hypothetical protein IKM43_03725 [Clostridia bacterium]|nr:hypothetical protein [Clostridia bacterium]
MIGELIVKKSKAEQLSIAEYKEIVDYILKHGADKSAIKFFVGLNSFGMSKKEVLNLTLALRDSGQVIDYEAPILEKHSTGGIGDSTSIVLIPLLASLGYNVAKTTGKSLMYTNGSTDRFCSIPNFNVNLTEKEIYKNLDNTNACVLSHKASVCPADRVLFDIIEMTGLENNLNLLAASIASKKLASGADVVLVDIKFGKASVVKTYSQAKELAKILKYVFKKCNVKSVMMLTNTLQTIGEGIGNAIEVVDGLKVLQGRKCFLRRVSARYAAEMISLINPELPKAAIYDMIATNLDNGTAYKKFLDIVRAQGGDVKKIEDSKIFIPHKSINFMADRSGYVGNINSLLLGELVRRLCIDSHDNHIGVALRVKIGDYVNEGDVILSFYYKNDEDLTKYKNAIAGSIGITQNKIKPIKVLKKVIK